jgi:hypothetical protein
MEQKVRLSFSLASEGRKGVTGTDIPVRMIKGGRQQTAFKPILLVRRVAKS